MKAVLMAGGVGTRLRPLTQILPKPLLPVGERSVLEIIFEKLRSRGFDDIIIATNYKSHLFESYFGDGSRFGVRITYSREREKLGTAGPLLLVKDKLREPFLVMNGDILTNLDFAALRNFHVENKAVFTAVTKKMSVPCDYGVVESKGDRVVGLKEKPVFETEILAGIYFLDPGVLALIPEGRAFDMPDLIRAAVDSGKKVLKYPLDAYWLDIGRMSDYEKANEDARNKMI